MALSRKLRSHPKGHDIGRQHHQNEPNRRSKEKHVLHRPSVEQCRCFKVTGAGEPAERREQNRDQTAGHEVELRHHGVGRRVICHRRQRDQCTNQEAVDILHDRADDPAHSKPATELENRFETSFACRPVSQSRHDPQAEHQKGHKGERPDHHQREDHPSEVGRDQACEERSQIVCHCAGTLDDVHQIESLVCLQYPTHRGGGENDRQKCGQQVKRTHGLDAHGIGNVENGVRQEGRDGGEDETHCRSEGKRHSPGGPDQTRELLNPTRRAVVGHEPSSGPPQAEVENRRVVDHRPEQHEQPETIQSERTDQ